MAEHTRDVTWQPKQISMSGHPNDTRSLHAILDGVRDPQALDGARGAIEEFRGIPNRMARDSNGGHVLGCHW